MTYITYALYVGAIVMVLLAAGVAFSLIKTHRVALMMIRVNQKSIADIAAAWDRDSARKPLDSITVSNAFQAMEVPAKCFDYFNAGVRWAEQQHGITGDHS